MPEQTHLSASQLDRFRNFELLAHSVVEGFVTGLHKSPFKGFAVEFAEHREYAPGDDTKHLDWKVFGRKDKFFVRQYEEDTSLRAHLLIDASGSMGYATGEHSKLDFAKFICGVLSFVLVQQADTVGLVAYDTRVRQMVAPGGSPRHLRRIIHTLDGLQPGGETAIGEVLHSVAERLRRRALIVIVSDLFDDSGTIVRALNHFAHRKHEVVVFQVCDRCELTFPFERQTRFSSLEKDEVVLADPLRIRREYQRQRERHEMEIRQACHRLRIELVRMVTDQPFERRMARYLAERKRG
jgi:uncharacterized protein (DUF58 family)